jgi:hypothetical protein
MDENNATTKTNQAIKLDESVEKRELQMRS